jgi:hypothetical protein
MMTKLKKKFMSKPLKDYRRAMHNSQDMETSKMQKLLMNGSRKCGIYTQWNFTQPRRRMKSYPLQVNGWNRKIPF